MPDETTRQWVEEVMDEALIPSFEIEETKYGWLVRLHKTSLNSTTVKAICRYKPFVGIRMIEGKLVLDFDK